MQMQHQQAPPPPPGVQQGHYPQPNVSIPAMNEAVWLQIGKLCASCPLPGPAADLFPGSFSEILRTPDEAMSAYERALHANPNSMAAMNAIGMLLKGREAFDKALEFFRAIVQIDQNNGEAWGNLGMVVRKYDANCGAD